MTLVSRDIEAQHLCSDVRTFSGAGFTGVDLATNLSTPDLQAALMKLGNQNLQIDELHPDAWEPAVIDDPANTTAVLQAAAADKYTYRDLDDFTDTIQRSLKTLPIVAKVDRSGVLAGNSAGQAAMFFANYASSVTLLVRGEGLSRSMSQYLIDQIANVPRIRVETETEVVSADGAECLRSIETRKRGASVNLRNADALFVMIGADAITHRLPPQVQRENGYVRTGREVSRIGWEADRLPFLLETSLPGFFCVGDVRYNSIKRVSSSVGEGTMAIAFVHQYLSLCSERYQSDFVRGERQFGPKPGLS